MRSQRQCHRRLRLPRQWSHLRHHDRPARLASSIPNVRGLIPTTAAPSSAAMPGNASGVADLPTAWAPSFIDHPLPVRVRSIPSTIGAVRPAPIQSQGQQISGGSGDCVRLLSLLLNLRYRSIAPRLAGLSYSLAHSLARSLAQLLLTHPLLGLSLMSRRSPGPVQQCCGGDSDPHGQLRQPTPPQPLQRREQTEP